MKFETFQAGVMRQRYQYKSFEPVLVNHEWAWEDATINALLEAANRALGELNAFSLIVPDIDLFIEMHVVKEAQMSSRIEGTHKKGSSLFINYFSKCSAWPAISTGRQRVVVSSFIA